MKKTLRITMLCLLWLVGISANAQDFEVDGISYGVITDTECAVISKGNTVRYSGNVVIPSSVTYSGKTYSVKSIGTIAFKNCTGLKEVTIPSSVTSIGEVAFSCCTSLTSVTIPNSVTEISGNAFADCTGLKSVTIPNSVTVIKNYAFSGCSALTSITIPNSVKDIWYNAFSGCTGLKSIKVNWSKPLNLQHGAIVSEETQKNCVLYVPKNTSALYKSAPIWSGFVNIQESDE